MRFGEDLKRLLPLVASAFLLAACDGDDGKDGAAGATGDTGTSCWDLNENGVADPGEDLNNDGVVDVLDCRSPLPGTAIAVTGNVSTQAGPLDRFSAVWFVPAGAAAGSEIYADVAADGSYMAELDEGDYTAYASRPGYEDEMVDPFTVTEGAANTLDFVLDEVPDDEYIGSADCGVCHTVEYASFKQTGHPFKLNKVENGTQPTYPFTTLNGVLQRIFDDDQDIVGGLADPGPGTDNGLGTPVTWDDISYVIGGYYWKARFVDQAGAIVTGTEVQYNFATDDMVAYHNNEANKKYNCGNCHTTGWRRYDADLNDARQDGLTFMDGTFHDGGIQCESCHAAGAAHAKFRGGVVRDAAPRSLAVLTADDAGYGEAVACGECHTRDGERDYPSYASAFDTALLGPDGVPGTIDDVEDTRPDEMGGRIAASGGLVRHHEQYDEAIGIDPDTLLTTRSAGFLATHGDCNTCHNPHGSSVNVDNPLYTGMPGVDKTNDGCVGCHPDYAPALRSGGMLNLQCIDCHMPYMAKSATTVPGEAERPTVGDVSSHIFTIALDSTQPQFTDDGKYAYPMIDEDWACATCHNTAPDAVIPFPLSDELVDSYIFHNNVVN